MHISWHTTTVLSAFLALICVHINYAFAVRKVVSCVLFAGSTPISKVLMIHKVFPFYKMQNSLKL